MSRSYYHTPIMHVTGRRSHREWRSKENRRYRRYIKNRVIVGDWDNLPPYKHKWCNPWSSPGDGKIDFFDLKWWACGEYFWHSPKGYRWPLWRLPACSDTYHHCIIGYKKLMRK